VAGRLGNCSKTFAAIGETVLRYTRTFRIDLGGVFSAARKRMPPRRAVLLSIGSGLDSGRVDLSQDQTIRGRRDPDRRDLVMSQQSDV
jgi:hypothetical protein